MTNTLPLLVDRDGPILAESFDAADALRWGIVYRVVPAASLAEETAALAKRVAAGPSVAYSRIKALLRASFMNDVERQMMAEQEAFCASARTADFAEGLSAFFEKRPAQFVGR